MAGRLTRYAGHVPDRLKRPKIVEELADSVSTAVQKQTKGGTSGAIRHLDDLLADALAATDAARAHANRVFLKVAEGLSDVERAIFRNITNGDWVEMMQIARHHADAFRAPKTPVSRDAAVRTLKGFLSEILFFRSNLAAEALKEATQRAKERGLKGSIFEIRDAVAITSDAGKISSEALTDGMLALRRSDGVWEILTVFEMKSRSNFRDLARGRGKKLKPGANTDRLLDEEIEAWRLLRREGQLSRDFERLAEATTLFTGKGADGTLAISKVRTRFVGVLPGGKRLSKKMADDIRREFPTFTPIQHAMRDETMQKMARELLEIVTGG